MKLVSMLIVLTVGAVAALAFLGKQMGVDVIDIKAPTLPSFNSMSDIESTVTGTATVHKWQDENGQWHFGDAPSEWAASQEVVIHTDQNIVQAYKAPPSATQDSSPVDQELEDDLNIGSGPLPSQMLLSLKKQAAEQALKKHLGQ